MKIYTKVVMDMASMEVLEEESFEYDGPLAECGSGGGGNAGSVEFPAHVTVTHKRLMDQSGAVTPTQSWMELYNDIVAVATPYDGELPHDPDVFLAESFAAADDFQTLVDLMGSTSGLDTYAADIISDQRITDEVAAFTALQDTVLNETVIPRFEAGMRDINAVMSSAFVIGKANIEADAGRSAAKFHTDLSFKVKGDDALQLISLRLQYSNSASHLIGESRRIGMISKGEEAEKALEYKVKDKVFKIGMIQSGSNLLAGPSGGTVYDQKGPSKTQTALGGAMSGAAIGASAGGPWGAAAGAVVGGILGYTAS